MGSTAGSSKHIARLKNYISWFEIPAFDIHRAAAFYNHLYNIEMEIGYNGDFAMAYFPADQGVGGAIVAGPGCTPNDVGSLIYLNAGNDMDGVLSRVESGGGRIIMPKSLISDTAGYFALFIDSEGNRLALHEGPTRVGPAPKSKAAARGGKDKTPKPAKAVKQAATKKPATKKTVAKKAAPKKAVKKTARKKR